MNMVTRGHEYGVGVINMVTRGHEYGDWGS